MDSQEPVPAPTEGEPVDIRTPVTSIATPPLRRAPERREMALILGLVFVLNLVPGGFLQIASLRWGLLVTQVLFIAGPVALALRWFYLDGRVVVPIRRPAGGTLAGAALGALALNHLLNLAVMWQDRRFPMPEFFRTQFESLSAFDGVSARRSCSGAFCTPGFDTSSRAARRRWSWEV